MKEIQGESQLGNQLRFIFYRVFIQLELILQELIYQNKINLYNVIDLPQGEVIQFFIFLFYFLLLNWQLSVVQQQLKQRANIGQFFTFFPQLFLNLILQGRRAQFSNATFPEKIVHLLKYQLKQLVLCQIVRLIHYQYAYLIKSSMKAQHQNKSRSFVQEFLFGGMAAFISKSVASPIEVVKLRLQVQYALIEKGIIAEKYEGISDCFRRLYKQNGLATFFKGNGTNALRFFLTQALNFSFRDLFRKMQQQRLGYSNFLTNLIAGGAAGASTQFITYPLDYARTRLANQVKNGVRLNDATHYNGLIDCIRKTYRSDGAEGLYRGFTASCVCMIIYRGFYFGIYDSYRPYIPKKYDENMAVTFCLGYMATITSGALSYPLDTVRRRMMMTSGETVKLTTMKCIGKIWSQGGWRAFFRGGAANIIGGFTGAAVFSVYDRIKVYYEKKYLSH